MKKNRCADIIQCKLSINSDMEIPKNISFFIYLFNYYINIQKIRKKYVFEPPGLSLIYLYLMNVKIMKKEEATDKGPMIINIKASIICMLMLSNF